MSSAAAQEAAARIQALLAAKGNLAAAAGVVPGATAPAPVGPGVVQSVSSTGTFEAEVEINDSPSRTTLTRGPLHDEIERDMGVAVTTKGRYMPPGQREVLSKTEKPLYLLVQAQSQQALDRAIARIREVEREAARNPPPSNFAPPRREAPAPLVSEKVFANIKPQLSSFELRGKILGPGGSYVKHIEQSTGARVFLRGKGSGFIETATSAEGTDPLHLLVTHAQSSVVQAAKGLCESLLETVRNQIEAQQQQQLQQQQQQAYYAYYNYYGVYPPTVAAPVAPAVPSYGAPPGVTSYAAPPGAVAPPSVPVPMSAPSTIPTHQYYDPAYYAVQPPPTAQAAANPTETTASAPASVPANAEPPAAPKRKFTEEVGPVRPTADDLQKNQLPEIDRRPPAKVGALLDTNKWVRSEEQYHPSEPTSVSSKRPKMSGLVDYDEDEKSQAAPQQQQQQQQTYEPSKPFWAYAPPGQVNSMEQPQPQQQQQQSQQSHEYSKLYEELGLKK